MTNTNYAGEQSVRKETPELDAIFMDLNIQADRHLQLSQSIYASVNRIKNIRQPQQDPDNAKTLEPSTFIERLRLLLGRIATTNDIPQQSERGLESVI